MESLPLEPFVSAHSVIKRYSYFTVVDAISTFNDCSLWYEASRLPEPLEKEVLTELVIAACTFPEKSVEGLYIFTVHTNMNLDRFFFQAILEFLKGFLLKTGLKSPLFDEFMEKLKPLVTPNSQFICRTDFTEASISRSSYPAKRVEKSLQSSPSDQNNVYSLSLLRSIGIAFFEWKRGFAVSENLSQLPTSDPEQANSLYLYRSRTPDSSLVKSLEKNTGPTQRLSAQPRLPPTVPNRLNLQHQLPTSEVARHISYLKKLGIDLITPKEEHDKVLAFIYCALTTDISLKTVVIDLNEEMQRFERKKELRASMTDLGQRPKVLGLSMRESSENRSGVDSAFGSEIIQHSSLPPIPEERTLHCMDHREVIDLLEHFQVAFPTEKYFENVTKTRVRGIIALLKHADIIDSISPMDISVQICLCPNITTFMDYKNRHDEFLIQSTEFSATILTKEDKKLFTWEENDKPMLLKLCNSFISQVASKLSQYPREFLVELTTKSALARAESAVLNTNLRPPATASTASKLSDKSTQNSRVLRSKNSFAQSINSKFVDLNDRKARNNSGRRSSSTSTETVSSQAVDQVIDRNQLKCIRQPRRNPKLFNAEVSPSISTLSLSPAFGSKVLPFDSNYLEADQFNVEHDLFTSAESFYDPFAKSNFWSFPGIGDVIEPVASLNTENDVPLSDYLRGIKSAPDRAVFQQKSINTSVYRNKAVDTRKDERLDVQESGSPFQEFNL